MGIYNRRKRMNDKIFSKDMYRFNRARRCANIPPLIIDRYEYTNDFKIFFTNRGNRKISKLKLSSISIKNKDFKKLISAFESNSL